MDISLSNRRLERLRKKLESLYLMGKFDEAIEVSRALDPLLVAVSKEKIQAAGRVPKRTLRLEKSW